LAIASKPEKASAVLPKDLFTALHNLAKHGIFLRENCEEAMATLDDLYNHHEAETGKDLSASQRHTRQALKYRMTLFESSQRRLASLNERISNIIQLSFHIVTQGDSKLMQSENKSMGTIAFMTLWFMPLSTVASIFGSQFMKLQDDHPYHLTVSRDFWLMWVVAVPLTAVVLAGKCSPDASLVADMLTWCVTNQCSTGTQKQRW
jgi:Mg2+ and Co2+ transporter CorA